MIAYNSLGDETTGIWQGRFNSCAHPIVCWVKQVRADTGGDKNNASASTRIRVNGSVSFRAFQHSVRLVESPERDMTSGFRPTRDQRCVVES